MLHISSTGLTGKYIIIMNATKRRGRKNAFCMCMCACTCALTVLSGHDDDGNQQAKAQHEQADGGKPVRLGNDQWANWSESGTN